MANPVAVLFSCIIIANNEALTETQRHDTDTLTPVVLSVNDIIECK